MKSDLAQTFILVSWLPIESRHNMKMRLEAAIVSPINQTTLQITFAFKILKITHSQFPHAMLNHVIGKT